MVSINSISASLYISQTTINISNVNGADKSDDANSQVTSVPDHSHGHRQRGAGFFMQSVMHALAGLGLNVPRNTSSNGDKDSSDNSSGQAGKNPADLGGLLATFLRDLHQVLARAGSAQSAVVTDSSSAGKADGGGQALQMPANVVAASSTAATGASREQAGSAVISSSSSPIIADGFASQAAVANFGEALRSFLHELRRTLQQSSDGANDDSGHKDREHGGKTTGWHRYRDFSANLDNLIADLNSADQADSDKYKSLTAAFSRLIDLMGSSNASGKPSLLAFLNKLKDEVANQNPTSDSSGAIVSASV